jgi:hypothetical protein
MSLLEINWKPEQRQLRQFASLWFGFFGLIGLLCLLRKGSLPLTAVWWVVASVGVAGVVWPAVMRPAYVVWMGLAAPIGWTVSHLLLLTVFYLVVTPVGLVMRLLGYDPLERRIDPAAKSYWIPHDPGAEPARYFKQY